MKGKHLFFDLDRTLWDFEKNSKAALKLMFAQFDLAQYMDDFSSFHRIYKEQNDLMWRAYGAGKLTKEELRILRFEKVLNYHKAPLSLAEKLSEFYIETSPYQTHLIKGSKETLDSLKKEGYALHIITNGFKEVQFIKLENCELIDYFDVILCSEEVGETKPHPSVFQYAMKRANAKTSDACMIGDDYQVDYLGALRSGMKAIFYNHQGQKKYRKDDEVVESLFEIPGRLPWLFR
ncbi:MAG: YjjG family noncanonical pyrimidine nucleotidase [Crocinitomicaceae bacterium]|nr:YjjG family noncanonical pyrimidine nucleotidase [Crocinitomicaceae bacterium]